MSIAMHLLRCTNVTDMVLSSFGGCSFLGFSPGLDVDTMNSSATVLGPGRPSSVTRPA